jgi:hypothetical protein
MVRHLSGAAVTLGTLILLVPAAELIVRVAAPQTLPSQSEVRQFMSRGMFLPSERPSYRPTPSFTGKVQISGHETEFTTNSLGLRDDEVGAKTVRRVLAFGDSFTWGWGVPQGEEWVSVVEKEMDRAAGLDAVETINCGVLGYGPENALAFLEELAPKLDPDVILFGFFDNDFLDEFIGAANLYTVRDGHLFDEHTHRVWKESFLQRSSHLWRLLSVARETAAVRWFGAMPAARPVRNFAEDDFRVGMERAAEHIVAMDRAAKAAGARFAVIFFPADVYVLPQGEPEVALHDELVARVAAAGIPYLDLLGPLRTERQPAGLYLPRDGHFTVRGNLVAGRAIARWLVEQVMPDWARS